MRLSKTFVKFPLFAALAGFLIGAADGCDDEPPIERQLCERFDECNFFGAGVGVDDCTDVMTMCTDGLLSSERADWERGAKAALENQNCANFFNQYQNTDVCYITTDGTISEGTGGPPSSGSADSGSPDPDPTAGSGTTGTDPQACGDEDWFTCTGEHSIEACIDGELYAVDCHELCAEDGSISDGCAFEEERQHDVCYCVSDGPDSATSGGDDGTTTAPPDPSSGTTDPSGGADSTSGGDTSPAPPPAHVGGMSELVHASAG